MIAHVRKIKAKRKELTEARLQRDSQIYEDQIRLALVEERDTTRAYGSNIVRDALKKGVRMLKRYGAPGRDRFGEITMRVLEDEVRTFISLHRKSLLKLQDFDEPIPSLKFLIDYIVTPREKVTYLLKAITGKANANGVQLQTDFLKVLTSQLLMEGTHVQDFLFRLLQRLQRQKTEPPTDDHNMFYSRPYLIAVLDTLECLLLAGSFDQRSQLVRAVLFDERLGHLFDFQDFHTTLSYSRAAFLIFRHILESDELRTEFLHDFRQHREAFRSPLTYAVIPSSAYPEFLTLTQKQIDDFQEIFMIMIHDLRRLEFAISDFKDAGCGGIIMTYYWPLKDRASNLRNTLTKVFRIKSEFFERYAFRDAFILSFQRRETKGGRKTKGGTLSPILPKELIMRLDEMLFGSAVGRATV